MVQMIVKCVTYAYKFVLWSSKEKSKGRNEWTIKTDGKSIEYITCLKTEWTTKNIMEMSVLVQIATTYFFEKNSRQLLVHSLNSFRRHLQVSARLLFRFFHSLTKEEFYFAPGIWTVFILFFRLYPLIVSHENRQ